MALAPGRTDHRWQLAVDASRFTPSQAQYQLRDADHVVQRAYAFKVAADTGADTSRWPEIEAAHEIWCNRAEDKLYAEGMFLGKGSIDQIAFDLDCGCQELQCFHDLFFDVTSRLDKPGWLVSRLFQGNLYTALNTRDRVGLMHRLSWLAGNEFFKSFYTGRWDDSIKEILSERLRDMLGKKSMLSAMCLGGQGELDVEVIRIFVDDAKKQVEASIKGAGSEIEDGVMAFLEHMSVKVADPSDPANLKLPAREPRAHDTIAALTKATV